MLRQQVAAVKSRAGSQRRYTSNTEDVCGGLTVKE